ncbi:transcriptional regulator [Streptomyces sp. NPDC049837]|uniref:transcriptional regulator n=1 Tax=Streptomyces sp. NPDC049837 TaxID=3155277 RepID=UPI00341F76E3
MAVLVGSSSTGKTRACWEAVQPLATLGWGLWHPFDPTRAEAALADLTNVGPRTVVWLNEAQHYLGAGRGLGERVAAALRTLLTDSTRAPVLILGTLWPEYANAYMAMPEYGHEDPYAQARELLADRLINLPDSFDSEAIIAAKDLAATSGDRQLAHALAHVDDGRLTQFLAGVPALLQRYQTATPSVRALLNAAVDARRLGAGLHMPLAFLAHAAEGYLTDDEYDAASENWLERALVDSTAPVHGNLAPLRRVRQRPVRRPSVPEGKGELSSPVYRLADYLEQYGRQQRQALCPPASFWEAARDHLRRPDDLAALAEAAENRLRLEWAHHLRKKAADAGSGEALVELTVLWEEVGNPIEAERLACQALELGDTDAMVRLASIRQESHGILSEAVRLYQKAAAAGDAYALAELAAIREEAGDRAGAEHLARKAADAGSSRALVELAVTRALRGDFEEGGRLAYQAANAGDEYALLRVAAMLQESGKLGEAIRIYRKAADLNNAYALLQLSSIWKDSGQYVEAERLARRAAQQGEPRALVRLAEMREQAGDHDEAERLARQAAEKGDIEGFILLADLRKQAGDHAGVERLAIHAAHAGDVRAVIHLVLISGDVGEINASINRLVSKVQEPAALLVLGFVSEEFGDKNLSVAVYEKAASAGEVSSLSRLAALKYHSGDFEEADCLARQAAEKGDVDGVLGFAESRFETGNPAEAERLAQLVVETGSPRGWILLGAIQEKHGNLRRAADLYSKAARAGDASALIQLAVLWEEHGEHAEAERLARHALDARDPDGVIRLARMRKESGDDIGAERLARQAADAGYAFWLQRKATSEISPLLQPLWPYGLDPDGAPSDSWQL